MEDERMRNTDAFRERFKYWKTTGELPYEAGLPKYEEGKGSDVTSEDFIKQYESFSPTVYQNPGDKPTIGYGTTDPRWVSRGRISEAEAVQALREYVDSGRPIIKKYIKNYDTLPDTAKVVLDDIYYNIGQGNLRKSPKFLEAVNSGNWKRAAAEMDWDNNKKGYGGARKRNAARQQLWLSSFPEPTPSKIIQINESTPKWTPQYIPYNTEYKIGDTKSPYISSWSSPDSPSVPAPTIQSYADYAAQIQDMLSENYLMKPQKWIVQ